MAHGDRGFVIGEDVGGCSSEFKVTEYFIAKFGTELVEKLTKI